MSNVVSRGGVATTQSLHTVILGNQVLRVQPMHSIIAANRAKLGLHQQQSTSTTTASSIAAVSSGRINTIGSIENSVNQGQRLQLPISSIINSVKTTNNSGGSTIISQVNIFCNFLYFEFIYLFELLHRIFEMM